MQVKLRQAILNVTAAASAGASSSPPAQASPILSFTPEEQTSEDPALAVRVGLSVRDARFPVPPLQRLDSTVEVRPDGPLVRNTLTLYFLYLILSFTA